jgi:signal transduction histidine kinase
MKSRVSSRRYNSVLLVIVIVLVAGSLLFASYQYSSSVSNGIQASSIDSANSGAQIEVTEMSHILVNQLLVVGKNLQVLSASAAVQSGNVSGAMPLFISAQNTTSSFTMDYSWISANGALLIAWNNTGAVPAPAGVNLTSRPYFVAVEQSGAPYFGDVILSLHLVPEVVVAWPVFNQTEVDAHSVRTFEGIVVASISVATLGSYLKSQLPSASSSGLGAIDPQGDILYSGNHSQFGLNIFGPQVQSELPANFAPSFNSFLHLSLQGGSGIYDLNYNGVRASIAYQAVDINATSSQTKPTFFAVLYVLTVDVLAADQAASINALRLFFAVSVVLIGVSGVIAALVVLNWNSRLDRIIKRRTAELVAANDELAEQAQAQKDLINIAAHELRTPAQSILANSELLKDALNPSSSPTSQYPSATTSSGAQPVPSVPRPSMSDGDVKDLVDSTFRNAIRLQKITNNLLEVARIDTKTVKIELESVDLNEKIESVVDDFRKIAEAEGPKGKDVRVVFEPESKALLVRADRIETYEVLSNLIMNAIRHSNAGGRVTVSSELSGDFALVQVRDEGTGIEKSLMPRLFEKFATNTGTGLGLYISKSYVEAMGGRIWADNNDTTGGTGATFSFTLPIVK